MWEKSGVPASFKIFLASSYTIIHFPHSACTTVDGGNHPSNHEPQQKTGNRKNGGINCIRHSGCYWMDFARKILCFIVTRVSLLRMRFPPPLCSTCLLCIFIPYSPNFYGRCSNPLVIFHVPKKWRRKGIAEAGSKEMSLVGQITIVGCSGGAWA